MSCLGALDHHIVRRAPLARRSFRALLVSAAMLSPPPALAAPSLQSRTRGALLGGLVGDALALGGQYEYDARVIAEKVGSYTDFVSPSQNHGANYHPGKVAGDMTDAGDVSVMLLEYLAQRGRSQRYTFDGYATHWLDAIKAGYGSCNFQSVGRDFSGACPPGLQPGYLNGGTRRTLDALQRFPGAQGEQRKALAADVNCLVSATHWAALLSMPYDNEDAMVSDAVSTTYLSHKNADPVAAAQFLARATYRIARGTPLREALVASAAVQRDAFIDARLREALAKVEEAADPSSALAGQGRFVDDTAITSLARLWDVGKEEPIKVGKASPTEGALPASIYFALRYENDLEAALIANANVGGDSAARGIVIGILLGAVHGEEAIPARWLATLRVLPRVRELLRSLEGAKDEL